LWEVEMTNDNTSLTVSYAHPTAVSAMRIGDPSTPVLGGPTGGRYHAPLRAGRGRVHWLVGPVATPAGAEWPWPWNQPPVYAFECATRDEAVSWWLAVVELDDTYARYLLAYRLV
jgi:hypothetical protein